MRLQQQGRLHPRFGFVDAYNADIADVITALNDDRLDDARCIATEDLVRQSGPWQSNVGFAIDQGPMLLLLDNYLEDQFLTGLFMSHPDIEVALTLLFPAWTP